MKGKLLFLITVLHIGTVITWLYFSKIKEEKQNNYKKVQVVRGDINVSILSTGYVQPENRLEIKSPVSGRVEQVLVIEGQMVKKGQILMIISSTERAALIDAASARGAEERKKWEEYYKPIPVFAPIDGTIILKSVEPGQSFTSQDAILVMSDRLTVKAQVDETDIAKIKQGQDANIVLDAYSERVIPAKVDKIAYDAKTINNVTTYIVDVLPVQTPIYMLSGMTANVTFSVDSKKDILLLPVEAVKSGDNYFYVLIGNKDATVIQKVVHTGVSDGKNIELIEGLSEGDVVLIQKTNTKSKKTTNGGPPSIFGKKN